MASNLQHCGIENHFSGKIIDAPLDNTILANVGVISGLSVTSTPSLSTNEYICCVISSPAFRLYNSCRSNTGASYSSNPALRPHFRNFSNNHVCNRNSSGKKSRVPETASRCTGGVCDACTVITCCPPPDDDTKPSLFFFSSFSNFSFFFRSFSAWRRSCFSVFGSPSDIFFFSKLRPRQKEPKSLSQISEVIVLSFSCSSLSLSLSLFCVCVFFFFFFSLAFCGDFCRHFRGRKRTSI